MSEEQAKYKTKAEKNFQTNTEMKKATKLLLLKNDVDFYKFKMLEANTVARYVTKEKSWVNSSFSVERIHFEKQEAVRNLDASIKKYESAKDLECEALIEYWAEGGIIESKIHKHLWEKYPEFYKK